ncbi:nitrite reductase small subunit NirD [Vogesella fluminis]|uniref:Rieske domain-containing protein n=1 Tax=Vogesella fluminis TaxID=1069161 RepID=A0ABQ3HCV9_9NEIS|nr:nitrite reductase small subunit NirD [Vogesella fluminis]GHD78726.1 hypothetical protein GCM10011419_21200 [Vogesella fluminis]
MSNWKTICQLNDIPVQGARVVKREGHTDIAIFRTADDQVFAMVDKCPHKGGPLSQGIVSGHSVTCPLHNWNIALETGLAQAPDEGCAGRIPVQLDGNTVQLALD